jgi:hypothetical protein
MNTKKETKINQLLQRLPGGSVATTKWLHEIGMSLGLITAYVRSGWLDRVGVGAVARRGQKSEWPGAVYALQSQAGLTVHPGGKTALGLLGSLHFVPLGNPSVELFSRTRETIPKWFIKHDWASKIEVTRTDLFGDDDGFGMTTMEMGNFSLKVSSHERAIMEYLYLLPEDNNSDEPVKLMEGLAWLRPDVLQHLLETCRSIKVKRLFLALSEQADHPWMRKLNLKRIDTGKGKRQFAAGGYLHPRFQITIPRSWHRMEQET